MAYCFEEKVSGDGLIKCTEREADPEEVTAAVKGVSTSEDGVITSTQKETVQSKWENVDHSAYIETSDPSGVTSEASMDFFDEEAWSDSVKKCKHSESHHNGYFETSASNIKSLIKKQIRILFNHGELYRGMLGQLLTQEITLIKEDISGIEQELPQYGFGVVMFSTRENLLEHYNQGLNIFEMKYDNRIKNALNFFEKELDNVTKEVMRKMKGVVRVQRKTTESREHGTGTGILVRLNWSGTCHTPRHARQRGLSVRMQEGEDFAILTNNHVIANEAEAKGATIDFFYDTAAGNKTQGGPPTGVVTKAVKKIITFSPRVPSGTQASSDQMDFSILKFEVGEDEEFINKLREYSFYLNEFLENDLPNRPFINLTIPLPLLAISHPHGSNKRISFGMVVEKDEVDQMCSNDRCSTSYELTTCFGSSGCPVLAIQVNSRGHLKAVLQFLHFRKKSGIRVDSIYNLCKDQREFNNMFWLFDKILCSREQMFSTYFGAAWWDESDRLFWIGI